MSSLLSEDVKKLNEVIEYFKSTELNIKNGALYKSKLNSAMNIIENWESSDKKPTSDEYIEAASTIRMLMQIFNSGEFFVSDMNPANRRPEKMSLGNYIHPIDSSCSLYSPIPLQSQYNPNPPDVITKTTSNYKPPEGLTLLEHLDQKVSKLESKVEEFDKNIKKLGNTSTELTDGVLNLERKVNRVMKCTVHLNSDAEDFDTNLEELADELKSLDRKTKRFSAIFTILSLTTITAVTIKRFKK